MDSFDFYLYVYALPGIIASFAVSKALGGLLATETLVASAFGGIAMGVLADRIGRKRGLLLTIGWYAAFTALCAFAQSYAQLAVLRTLEGIGFGGEWAVGAALASEWSSPNARGRNLGFVQSAWAIGWLCANVAFQVTVATVPSAHAWRILFALGILPALALFFMRRGVSDAYPALQTERERVSPVAIVRGQLARTTLLATMLAAGLQSAYYALFTWMPSYLSSQRGLPSITTGSYLYAVIAGSFFGYVSAGFVSDALGRRTTFIAFAICSALMVPIYLAGVTQSWQLLPAGFFLGYFVSGIFSGFGPFLSELYPTAVRASGQGFCYNVGRGIAGAAPYLVGLFASRGTLGTGMIGVAVVSYVVAIVALLMLPETRGRSLC